MKKLLLIVCALFLLLCSTGNVYAKKLDIDLPKVTEHEKVKIYLFRGKGCTHCYDFLTYFNEHFNQFKKYIEIVSFETYKDNDNKVLKNKVNDYLEITDEKDRGSVPLIVIGNWYTLGFVESDGIDIIKEALKQYENADYVDGVAKLINDENIQNNPETLREACNQENIIDNSNSNNILIIILVFLVMGFSSVIILSKKK